MRYVPLREQKCSQAWEPLRECLTRAAYNKCSDQPSWPQLMASARRRSLQCRLDALIPSGTISSTIPSMICCARELSHSSSWITWLWANLIQCRRRRLSAALLKLAAKLAVLCLVERRQRCPMSTCQELLTWREPSSALLSRTQSSKLPGFALVMYCSDSLQAVFTPMAIHWLAASSLPTYLTQSFPNSANHWQMLSCGHIAVISKR